MKLVCLHFLFKRSSIFTEYKIIKPVTRITIYYTFFPPLHEKFLKEFSLLIWQLINHIKTEKNNRCFFLLAFFLNPLIYLPFRSNTASICESLIILICDRTYEQFGKYFPIACVLIKSIIFLKYCLFYFIELDLLQNVVINFQQRDSYSDISKRPTPTPTRFRIDGFCVNIILFV